MKKIYFFVSFLFINVINLSETYEVSWEGIADSINKEIETGLVKIIDSILVILTLLTVIGIIMMIIKYIANVPLEKLIPEFIRILVNFAIYSYIIKNSVSIINSFFNIFYGIGRYFSNNNPITLGDIWNKGNSTVSHIFKVINDWQIYVKTLKGQAEIILNIPKFIENFGKVILLYIAILFIYYIFIRVIVELLMATLQFRVGLALSIPFLSTETNNYLKNITGGKFLTVLFTGGLKITVNTIFASIFINIIDKVKFTENLKIDTIDIQNVFLFVAVSFVLSFLLNKTNKIVTRLAN